VPVVLPERVRRGRVGGPAGGGGAGALCVSRPLSSAPAQCAVSAQLSVPTCMCDIGCTPSGAGRRSALPSLCMPGAAELPWGFYAVLGAMQYVLRRDACCVTHCPDIGGRPRVSGC